MKAATLAGLAAAVANAASIEQLSFRSVKWPPTGNHVTLYPNDGIVYADGESLARNIAD